MLLIFECYCIPNVFCYVYMKKYEEIKTDYFSATWWWPVWGCAWCPEWWLWLRWPGCCPDWAAVTVRDLTPAARWDLWCSLYHLALAQSSPPGPSQTGGTSPEWQEIKTWMKKVWDFFFLYLLWLHNNDLNGNHTYFTEFFSQLWNLILSCYQLKSKEPRLFFYIIHFTAYPFPIILNVS